MNDAIISGENERFFRIDLCDGLFLFTKGARHPLPENFLCPECSARLFTSGDIDWGRYDQPGGHTKALESPNYDNGTGRLSCSCGFMTKLRLFSWRK